MLKPDLTGSLKFRLTMMVFLWSCVLLYKFEDLSLPYYWDEMAGYMSGILYMVDNGISLFPSAVPAQMSYGHPLLMHAFMAFIIRIFGSAVEVTHITTLVFTCILSYGTYLLAYEISKNRYLSALTFFIFLVQPIVLAQSTQVLLEVFLCLHTVFALLFYLRKQYISAMVFCCMGLMTKETGLVLAIAFVCDISLGLFWGEDRKQSIKRLGIFSIPFVLFGGFLLIQKQTYGWYLNPVNVGKTKLDIESMMQKLWDYPLEFTFVNQGRYGFTLLLISSVIFYLIQKKPRLKPINLGLLILPIFCGGFLIFSSIADALERYFLMLMPFAAILFAYAAIHFGRFHKVLPVLLTCIAVTFNILNLESDKRYTEVDMGYRHMVKTNMAIFEYVNSGEFENDSIGFAFPFQYAPVDQRFGYYKNKHFISDTTFSKRCPYKIYSSPGNADWNPPDTLNYMKIKEFRSGYSKSTLFKRKYLF